MVKTFKLEILASDHVFYSGECDELIFPGQDGSFGILPNHQPMITCLNAGELRYRTGAVALCGGKRWFCGDNAVICDASCGHCGTP